MARNERWRKSDVVTMKAVFNMKLGTFSITASAGANGTIYPEGISTVIYGNDLTFGVVWGLLHFRGESKFK